MNASTVRSRPIFSRRLSDTGSLINNQKSEGIIDRKKCSSPPSLTLTNNKGWRLKTTEETFSIMTKVMDKSIDLYVQQENLVALFSILVGLLYNRSNYDIFKDMDLNVLAMHTTSYIKSHIPNLLYLKKAHNVANDMVKLFDNPSIPLPERSFWQRIFLGENKHDINKDDPKLNKRIEDMIEKFFKGIYRGDANKPVAIRHVKRHLIEKFQSKYYNKKTTGLLLHILDRKYLNLTDAFCAKIDLVGVCYENVTFTNVDFHETSFRGATLINVKFKDCDLRSACFDESYMKKVTFDNVWLECASFKNAMMLDTSIAIQEPEYSSYNTFLRAFFYHKENKDNKSILTTIESISDAHAKIKISLLYQVIGITDKSYYNIKNKDYLARIAVNFLEILVKPIYMQDAKIKDYVINRLLRAKMRYLNYNFKITASRYSLNDINFNKYEIKLYLDYLKENIDKPALDHKGNLLGDNQAIIFNHSINQILYWAQEYTKQDTSLLPAYHECREAVENKLKVISQYKGFIGDDEEYYAILTEEYKRYVFVNHEDFGIFMYGNNKDYQQISLDRIMYSDEKDAGNFKYVREKADEIFGMLPILGGGYRRYKEYLQSSAFARFIETLHLGEYEKDFIEAPIYKAILSDIYKEEGEATTKLRNIEQSHANKLAYLFGRFIEGGNNKIYDAGQRIFDIAITAEHYKDIKRFFKKHNSVLKIKNKEAGNKEINKKDNNKQHALLLFALSITFARYSSVRYFGNTENSPIAIRNYALALLNKAVMLYPQILTVDQVDDYRGRFAGTNGKESHCTETISNMMKDYILKSNDKEWQAILELATPNHSGWREWISKTEFEHERQRQALSSSNS